MAETQSNDLLVGAYDDTAPGFNARQYTSYEALANVVKDLIYGARGGSNGLEGKLSSHHAAETFYDLGYAFAKATKRLGEVNDAFAAEVKKMGEALEGSAGEEFQKYAKDLLKESEEVFQTLSRRDFGMSVGNIGHAIQWFANEWWTLVDKYDAHRVKESTRIKNVGKEGIRYLANNANGNDVSALIDQLAKKTNEAIKKLDDDVEKKLLAALQDLTTNLSGQYTSRGQDLVPLMIISGLSKAQDPRYDGKLPEKQGATGGAGKEDPRSSDAYRQAFGEARKASEADLDKLIAGTDDPVKKAAYEDAKEQLGAALSEPELVNGTVTRDNGATPDAEVTNPARAEEAGGLPSTASAGPAPDTGSGATTSASPAAGQAAAERQAGLDAAKQAADQAIDALGAPVTSPSGDGSSPAPAGPSSLPAGGAGDTPVGGALPAGGSGTPAQQEADRKRQKALDDAKKAADDAIDGLTGDSGAGLPGAGGGGTPSPAEQQAAGDAKAAASKALDDLAGQTDDPARKQALQDAQAAAEKAIDGITDAGTPSTSSDGPAEQAAGGGGGAGAEPLDQKSAEAYGDAKHAASKAIDDLIAGTDDPVRKAALEQVKETAENAIDNAVDPGHHRAVEDAKDQAQKAVDQLGQPAGSADHQQAVDAARKAIDGLDDARDPSAPDYAERTAAAKAAADQAIDGLAGTDSGPQRAEALDAAKQAVHKAIDSIGSVGGTSASGRALEDFLNPATGSGSGGGAGSGGGGGLPSIGGLGESPGGGGTAGASSGPQTHFDTDAARQRGLVPPGVPASVSAGASPGVPAGGFPGAGAQGMPMAPGMPPMGGMGGMGGSPGGDKEREPQVWIQAAEGSWADDNDDRPRSPVLGRD
ncbi:hypothetical protein [Lentzea sp. NPDC059081]|uniref:hypothetical protein n=1 Tax=Lentzea sp. NPDC059081 TaxID=3346719 RepID=UPI00367E54E7